MTLPGVAFVYPNEEGWAVYQLLDSDEVNFGRFWPSQDTDVILVKVIQLGADLNDKEFLSDLQAGLDRRGPTP